MNPSIVLLCIPLSASKEILMPHLRATILSEGMTSPLHVKELVSDHHSYTNSLSSCEIKAWKKVRFQRDSNSWPLRYRFTALPTELSSHLGARHIVSS